MPGIRVSRITLVRYESMSALFGSRFCAKAVHGANASAATAPTKRSKERRSRWAHMTGLLVNERPDLARRSATLASARRACKARGGRSLGILGPLRLLGEDDRNVFEVDLR